jgi:hypothetical protein
VEELNERNRERAYSEGRKAAYTQIMLECMRRVGGESVDAVALLAERQGAIATLRDLCAEYGDNDWPDDLHLVDIIEKHLARHLEREG